MPSPSDPVSLLRDLSAACDESGCRWYVFGAQAVIIWGRPRLTTDVDITVILGSISTSTLIATLLRHRFQLGHDFSEEFVRELRVVPLRHVPTRLTLDVVLGGPGLEEQFADRSVTVDLSGFDVPVISPEDLIVTKVFAGRPKDIEDVRGVLAIRLGRLDLEYIRHTLGLLESALGQSDLAPAFDRALDSVRGFDNGTSED